MFTTNPIPALNDNYIWMIIQDDTQRAVIIDPGESAPVLETLNNTGLTLEAILITHHHYDHTDGIPHIIQSHPAPVYAWEQANIPHTTHTVSTETELTLFDHQLTLQILAIPGHTLDHIAYYGHNQLFCGDTLFSGGCGRIFEGTPQQMHKAVNTLIALPEDTQLYCAHEYTLSNLAFAKAVEPHNPDIDQRLEKVQQLRKNNQPTLPSTIALERATNPFCRVHVPEVVACASLHAKRPLNTPLEVFTELRLWKDHF